MKLIHYSSKPFDLKPNDYSQDRVDYHAKPHGLWVSAEGDLGEDNLTWKEWCEQENFELKSLNHSYLVNLKPEARILYLKTPEEILEFGVKFPYIRQQWNTSEGRKFCATNELDWIEVKNIYQGIIISPYQWTLRLSNRCNWYYGWDCASGCIWDLSCIESFEYQGQNIVEAIN